MIRVLPPLKSQYENHSSILDQSLLTGLSIHIAKTEGSSTYVSWSRHRDVLYGCTQPQGVIVVFVAGGRGTHEDRFVHVLPNLLPLPVDYLANAFTTCGPKDYTGFGVESLYALSKSPSSTSKLSLVISVYMSKTKPAWVTRASAFEVRTRWPGNARKS